MLHYAGWDALVESAATGDAERARLVVRDLTAGAVAPHPSLETIGGALAFVRFAEDAEELADAVTTAAVGCGECHEAHGARPPERPGWGHERGADWAVWGLVWNDASAPPAGREPPVDALVEAWGPGPDGVARVLETCAGCHLR